ncbi:helix-turn-helix transcriptional regulator [Streptosporangium sp. NBC_01756]|uniref:helix-turn-helix transcriptional regulator n=1 Tax=Streptosporangium sp. NBC_01756 TaxID=2975950 RepID=UPI002DDA3DC1|nr:WYL domain-containing protein [Streptosporangium sp. NBC_01756]WSC85473.1 WYL domain-containing protein [Streptosporangium sp. NBC_01756]
MRDPSGRLLQLLSLLQTPREWPGAELAGRLGVTPRTIRRDVDRLRELGYPVHATQGNTGGYRLTAGAAMPPLLLDDDEAVAIAIGLRIAATAAVTGIEDTSPRALAKLEQVLPVRLRHRVAALSDAAVVLPLQDGPAADADTLAAFAAACVAHEKVRFGYTRAHGEMTRRLVEPHQLVASGHLWYLVAYDEDRAGWRSFRVDRISEVHRTGVRVPGRELPGGVDTRTWVAQAMPPRDVRARLLLHVPIEEAVDKVPAWQGTLEPVDHRSCRLHTHPDSPRYLAYRITLLPVDYTLLDPPELAGHLRAIAERAGRAVDAFADTSQA